MCKHKYLHKYFHKYEHKYLHKYLTPQTFAQICAQLFAQLLRLQIVVQTFVNMFVSICKYLHKYLHRMNPVCREINMSKAFQQSSVRVPLNLVAHPRETNTGLSPIIFMVLGKMSGSVTVCSQHSIKSRRFCVNLGVITLHAMASNTPELRSCREAHLAHQYQRIYIYLRFCLTKHP